MGLSDAGAPLAMKIVDRGCPSTPKTKLNIYRLFILLLTFLSYTCYHMSRKPISVVKNQLLNCTSINGTFENGHEETTVCYSFISEINGTTEAKGKQLESYLDTTYLFSYAFFMFISGVVAERVDLRYFLSIGMILSGVFTMLFGLAKVWGVHTIGYFLFVQLVGGAFQATGWPGVVTVVANWFGKGKKGVIFGIWNSHTSIGNILGSLLAGLFVDDDWGLSFVVPGLVIGCMGVIFFFVLVPKPEHVGLDLEEIQGSTSSSPERQALLSPSASASGDRNQLESMPLLDSDEDDEEELTLPEKMAENSSDDKSETGQHAEVVQNGYPGYSGDDSYDNPMASTSDFSTEVRIDAPDAEENARAITFWGALRIPGVVEFALCLFFAKLVSYTFLYWLPTFIKDTGIDISNENAAYLSTLFDVGGIIGGILAGLTSDLSGKSATTCAVMLMAAIPMLFGYEKYGNDCPLNMETKNGCYSGNIALLMFLGLLVNGPYALITTAVSAELGTHPSLRGSSKALATVTSIIDGTGSVGAAIGPFLAGSIPGYDNVFYMLMAADIIALLLLTRLVKKEIESVIDRWNQRRRTVYGHQS